MLLTTAGEAIIARARTVLREVDAIRDFARDARDPKAGSIRLGMFPTLGPYLLPHVIPALHRRFPRLELLLIEEESEELLNKLERGELDAALLALPAGDESLTTAVLFEEPFLLALPRERAADFPRARVKLSELREQQVLLLEEGHCIRTQALSLCELGGASERGAFRATSLETLRQMVAANVGMTLLPQLSVMPPIAANDNLLLRHFAEPQPKRQIGLLWRKSDARKAFARFVLYQGGKTVNGISCYSRFIAQVVAHLNFKTECACRQVGVLFLSSAGPFTPVIIISLQAVTVFQV